jgi:hypothetical protein
MAKIFISYTEDLKPLADFVSNFLRKNSGHRPALYQEQSDFTLELDQDWAGGNENPSLFIFENNQQLQDIGKTITNLFREQNILAEYPKRKNDKKEFPTLLLRAGRVNHSININQWGEIIGLAIIKYFNPEYINQGKDEKEPLRKRPQDKTYYDRTFNNTATNNASLLFKKK